MPRTQSRHANAFFVSPDDPPSKREIMKAALALFAERGIDGVSIRDIADRAGYSNPAIFKFFKTKDDLAEHLFIACYRELSQRFAAADRSERPFRQNLRVLLEEFAAVVDYELDAFLFVTDHLRRLWPKVSRRLTGLSILGIVQRVVSQRNESDVAEKPADSKLLVAGIVGALSQFARMTYFGEFSGPTTAQVDALESLVLKMCR